MLCVNNYLGNGEITERRSIKKTHCFLIECKNKNPVISLLNIVMTITTFIIIIIINSKYRKAVRPQTPKRCDAD